MSESIAAAAPDDRGFLSTLLDVFVAPGDAFRSIAARPRFLAPIALAVGLGLAFTAIWITKVDPVEFMRQSMEESGAMDRIPAEKRAEVLSTQARVFKAMAWIGPLVFAPLMYAALAGLFYVVFRFFYGADVSFRQSIAVVGWTFAAFSLLTTPLVLLVMSLKGEWNIDPQSAIQASVAGLLDKAMTPKPVYSVAGSLDLFSFWAMALLSIGYAAAMRTRATAAAWGIVIPWACWVLGKAALSALF
jgi:hypothetical protein